MDCSNSFLTLHLGSSIDLTIAGTNYYNPSTPTASAYLPAALAAPLRTSELSSAIISIRYDPIFIRAYSLEMSVTITATTSVTLPEYK